MNILAKAKEERHTEVLISVSRQGSATEKEEIGGQEEKEMVRERG